VGRMSDAGAAANGGAPCNRLSDNRLARAPAAHA